MACGRVDTCTEPFAAVTVTGNAPRAPAPPGEPEPFGAPLLAVVLHAAAAKAAAKATAISRRTGACVITHPPVCRGGRSASVATPRRDRNEPPFLRGQVVDPGQASGLVLRPEASPLRDSAGFTPASLCTAPSREIRGTREAYFTDGALGHEACRQRSGGRSPAGSVTQSRSSGLRLS